MCAGLSRKVSILVLLEKLLEAPSLFGIPPSHCVSILVLLEKLLEALVRIRLEQHQFRFNPCSSGKATGSLHNAHTFSYSAPVSILVLLEKLLEVFHEHCGVRLRLISFQSLFFWKSYWKMKLRACSASLSRLVSILVLLEKLLEDHCAQLALVCVGSFNPCSSGKATGRKKSVCCSPDTIWVSILVLLEKLLEGPSK